MQTLKKMPTLLSFGKREKGGRNRGLIAVPRRKALVKNRTRFIDWKRKACARQALVIVEHNIYDCNRTANLTLLAYPEGALSFIIETTYINEQKITFNLHVQENPKFKGWSNFVQNLPLGTIICCIETIPGLGAKLIRSAGTSAVLLKKTEKFAVIKLKSGEHRKFSNKAIVVVDIVGNSKYKLRNYKKAGIRRLLGVRPTVRAFARNPVDHPMGGRTKGGCTPKSQTGKLSHGSSTKPKKKHKLILISARQTRLQKR